MNSSAVIPASALPPAGPTAPAAADPEGSRLALPAILPCATPYFLAELVRWGEAPAGEQSEPADLRPVEAAPRGQPVVAEARLAARLCADSVPPLRPGETTGAPPARPGLWLGSGNRAMPAARDFLAAFPPGLEIVTPGREDVRERLLARQAPPCFSARVTPPAAPGPRLPLPWMMAAAGSLMPIDAPPPPAPGAPPAGSPEQPETAVEPVCKRPPPQRDPAPPPGGEKAAVRALHEMTAARTAVPAGGLPAPASRHAETGAAPPRAEPALHAGEVRLEAPPENRAPAVREIQLRVPACEESPVNVRVIEHAGQIHVDVRTREAALSSALREHLGELVSRLESHGFRAETWSPDGPRAASSPESPGSQLNRPSHHDAGPGSGRHSGAGDSHAGRERRRNDQPSWLARLNGEFGDPEEELP